MLAGINSCFINIYSGTYCQSNLFKKKKAFKGKHQFKEKTKSFKRQIPVLTHSLSQQIQDPNGVQQKAKAPSLGFSHKAKRETTVIKWRASERVSPGCCLKQVPCKWGPSSWGGWQARRAETQRLHIRAALAWGKQSWQFCMQHPVMTKTIKITTTHWFCSL